MPPRRIDSLSPALLSGLIATAWVESAVVLLGIVFLVWVFVTLVYALLALRAGTRGTTHLSVPAHIAYAGGVEHPEVQKAGYVVTVAKPTITYDK